MLSSISKVIGHISRHLNISQEGRFRMMLPNLTCKKHENEKISFICSGNVWHFEPLCNACIPEHTKNHPKNIKVQLEDLKEVLPKAAEIKAKVSTVFEERLKKWSDLSEIKEDAWAYITSLNLKRQTILKEVNTFFDELITETRKKRIEEEYIQHQNLTKIGEQIKEKIAFFKKGEYSDITSFCNEIKKYYFKENMQIYVQEMDEILKDYEQKVIKYDPFAWSKDLPLKLKKMFIDSYKLQDPSDKSIKQKPDPKKQPKKKQPPPRKRCPTCKQQMQYLTQWKKHLICRSCGGKQRNYVKRS